MRAREFDNSKLVIFDIDDTLVNTDTKVGVVRDGKTIKKLDSHDFTHYKLEPGEEFDFGAFRDAREFFANARPIAPMIRQLKQDIATGNRVIMVTARADFNDRDIFLSTFEKWGIDMSKVHVYRAGNIQMKVATEEKKKIILRHLLGKTHYDKVIMYDDAVPNLDAFLSLAQEYPWSKFYAWHVDREGGATEYHRSGASLRENTVGGRTATGEQVLKYILKTQGESEFRDFLRKEILAIPQWELVNVPLSSLHIPDLDYDEGEDYEVKADPYGRVLFVDFDYAGEVSARNIDRLPIVIDSQGHIFDGNHRAWAAAELMNRSTIPAWRPATGIAETIRKIGANRWRLYSKDGSRNLGTFDSLAAAKKHEQEVQAFKHMKEDESKPVRAYHGNQGGIDTEQLHTPMWFTASRPDAEHYAGDDGYVVVVDLDIQNPYVLRPGEEANTVLRRWQELQAQGYDGIHDRRLGDWIPFTREQIRVISKDDTFMGENFADGKVKGKSRPGRVKRAGASCKGSVTDLRAKARKYGGERGKMYHWCANMKSGKKKN